MINDKSLFSTFNYFWNMKSVFFLMIFSFGFLLYGQEEPEDTNRIFWSESVKLTWDDFQAEKDKSAKIAALSSIGLPYRYITDGEGEISIIVKVCFIKDESWSVEGQQQNLLLQHEQLHFDIAELHRRMIVKEFLETEFTKKNYKEKVEAIIEKYWLQEYRVMQDQYDRETNYSRVVQQQINWNEKVANELSKLQDYTETDLEISLINFD